ncbi:MAG: DUF1800 family protein, partial [Ignavibacteriota bacterium]
MDRRSFLKTAGLTAAGTAAVASTASAAELADSPLLGGTSPKFLSVPTRERLAPLSTDLSPWVPSVSQPWDVHTINHLYRRAGFGATLAEIKTASAKTPSEVVDAMLQDSLLTKPPVPALPTGADLWLHVAPYIGTDQTQLNAQMSLYYNGIGQIRSHWTAQMNQPDVLLREKMALFWMNHFVFEATKKVYYPQSVNDFLTYFREHAWGNFKEMVSYVTTSPAMLIYLDGILNIGSAPNENYAREVQELFTMGVVDKDGKPNYTQDDVEALALIFSGWVVKYDAPPPNLYPAEYIVSRHGTKRLAVYDTTARIYNLEASGASKEKEIIDHIFEQRGSQIAWYMCSKLYKFFVYEDTSSDAARIIIDSLAATLMYNNWEMKPVLAQLLKSAHFFDELNIGAQIKSPNDHMVGLLRSFDLTIDEMAATTAVYHAYS